MAVALAVERRIQFYESDDLVGWRHLSDFTSAALPSGIGSARTCSSWTAAGC